MVSLPQLVRRRLQRQAEAGPHPDSDQLTAFLESGLTDAERAHVLKHIAACTDCREIMFLSLPEIEAGQQVIGKPRIGWMQWPALRWGAVAACALVVGTAVTLNRQPRSKFAVPPVAGVESNRDAMASKQSSATSRPSEAVVLNEKKKDSERTSEDLEEAEAANQSSVLKLESPSAPMLHSSSPQSAQSAKVGRVPAPERANSDVSGRLDSLRQSRRDEDRRLEKRDETPSNVAENAPSAPPVANAERATGKAKEPLSKNEVAAEDKKSALGNEQGTTIAGGLVLAPRWTLSADGTLQRSFNAGTTWETIPVAAKAKLHALAAIGNEIWVGGSSGALYHSSDAGNRWTQVKPTCSGRSLTSDIIGVEFTDTQHGKLTLADGEVWTTVDGGQSWNKN